MVEYACPHCKQPIYDNQALLCLYCGQSLNRKVGFIAKTIYPASRIVIAIAVIIALLSLAFLMSC
jgi:hypothetical protein